MKQSVYQCPCCDHFTLPERCDWDICPVCFWEDDGPGVDRPDSPSPANGDLTLRQVRANFRAFGACDERALPSVLPASERSRYRWVARNLVG